MSKGFFRDLRCIKMLMEEDNVVVQTIQASSTQRIFWGRQHATADHIFLTMIGGTFCGHVLKQVVGKASKSLGSLYRSTSKMCDT